MQKQINPHVGAHDHVAHLEISIEKVVRGVSRCEPLKVVVDGDGDEMERDRLKTLLKMNYKPRLRGQDPRVFVPPFIYVFVPR